MKGEVKKDTEEKKQAKIGEELEQYSSGTIEKKKTTEMQPNQQGRKRKLKLTILQFHSLKDCKKES